MRTEKAAPSPMVHNINYNLTESKVKGYRMGPAPAKRLNLDQDDREMLYPNVDATGGIK